MNNFPESEMNRGKIGTRFSPGATGGHRIRIFNFPGIERTRVSQGVDELSKASREILSLAIAEHRRNDLKIRYDEGKYTCSI